MSIVIHSASTGFAASSPGVTVNISSFAMVAAVIFLSLLLTFLIFVYLYTHFYGGSWYTDSTYRRAQFLSDSGAATRGLDPAVLSSLPISICRPIDLELALECSVCLSELSSSEAARFLPKCSHGFHLECIDKWFRSHSTCPLCRCPVGAESSSPAKVTPSVGASQRVDSGSSISIPIRSTEGCLPSPVSPLPSSTSQSEELKSPEEGVRSPAASKLRTLRKLLSMGKKTGGSACSGSRVCDVEQGNTASPEEK